MLSIIPADGSAKSSRKIGPLRFQISLTARIARSARIRVELPAHRADGDGGEGDDGVVPLPKFVRFVDLKAARIV
ncbi:MAG: hypothetical protein ACXWU0_08580, partial [Rhodoplanes sp.]